MAEKFRCTLVTPEEQVLDEQITYASIPAWDGQIGLLSQRSPLLAKLGYGKMQLDLADGSKRTYFVGGGFAQMKNHVLTILTDEAVTADKIDTEEAEVELKEAQAARAVGDEEIDRREQTLARARGRLAVGRAGR